MCLNPCFSGSWVLRFTLLDDFQPENYMVLILVLVEVGF